MSDIKDKSNIKRITDISAESPVEITADNKKGSWISFPTKVCFSDDNSVYLEPIMKDGKYLNFGSIAVSLQVTIDGLYYSFNLSQISLIKNGDKIYHKVTCPLGINPSNRRGAPRIKYSSPVIVLFQANTLAKSGTLKDLSYTGLAFSCNGKQEVEIGASIMVSFQHNKLNINYKVDGTVVRYNYREEDGVTEIAIHFHKDYPAVNELITYLQRQDISRLRDRGRV